MARRDALAHYAKVSRDNDLTDDMLAWKVRAALRVLRGPDWEALLQAVNAMSEEAQAEPAWIYWKARALLAKGGETAAPRPAPAGIDRLDARLLRAAGPGRTGPQGHRAAAARRR